MMVINTKESGKMIKEMEKGDNIIMMVINTKESGKTGFIQSKSNNDDG